MNKQVTDFINNFVYIAEKRDRWSIINKAPYSGDCDDFSLTVLYLLSNNSWLRVFWNVATFNMQLWFVTTDKGEGHLTLWVRGRGWIDNIYRFKGFIPTCPHKKRFPYLLPLMLLKLALHFKK